MDAVVRNGPISRFALYGEKPGSDDPEFVHIEDIQSRSSLYDWRIAPHMHRRMFQIVHLIAGTADVELDGAQSPATGPCAICVPGNVVHGFRFTPETHGYVVTVAESLLLDGTPRDNRDLLTPLLNEPRIVPVGDAARAAFMAGVLTQMAHEFQARELGRNAMFDWLFHALLMTIRRQIEPGAGAPVDGRDTFSRACGLIEDHYRTRLSVAAYATRLGISRARLNRLCRRFAGKTFLDLVHDRLTLEAQRHLIYTSATVEMIAGELGFGDAGYFCRFFRRRTGMTPSAFRRERQAA